jgi:hypothetical protein
VKYQEENAVGIYANIVVVFGSTENTVQQTKDACSESRVG